MCRNQENQKRCMQIPVFLCGGVCKNKLKFLISQKMKKCYNKRGKTMRIEEHFENFMTQPDVEKYIDLYEAIVENRSDDWLQIYYALINEIGQDRGLFTNDDRLLKEYGQMRELAETVPDEHTKKCFITALFDALMVEKIKTYSLHFDAPAILADELHEMYLKESVYDDEDEF